MGSPLAHSELKHEGGSQLLDCRCVGLPRPEQPPGDQAGPRAFRQPLRAQGPRGSARQCSPCCPSLPSIPQACSCLSCSCSQSCSYLPCSCSCLSCSSPYLPCPGGQSCAYFPCPSKAHLPRRADLS